MNDQDLVVRLTGPVADPDPATVDAARGVLGRRVARRKQHRRARAGSVLAIGLIAGTSLASRVGRDQPQSVIATKSSENAQPSEADPGQPAPSVTCGAVPAPAERAGLSVTLPDLDAFKSPGGDDDAQMVDITIANKSQGQVQIATSQLEIAVIAENGAIASTGTTGELGISALEIDPGASVRSKAFMPKKGCGATKEPLAPGTYEVAVVFTARTGGVSTLLRSPVGQVTYT